MCRSIRPAVIACLLSVAAFSAADESSTSTDSAFVARAERAVDETVADSLEVASAEDSESDTASAVPDETASGRAAAATENPSGTPIDADSAAGIGAADSSGTDAADAGVAPPLDNAADPFQGFNRGTFAFNEFADRLVLRPVAAAYGAVMPDLAERGVHNALENLSQPVVAINQLLQDKLDLAANDAARFLLNSTVGLVGLIDVAAQFGLPAHKEDFGQTLGVWGVPQGPFLMLPLLGPSSSTTAAGSVLAMLFKPTTWISDTTARYAIAAVGVVDTRAQLLEADGLVTGDRYTFIRDAYLQRRAYLQADGVVDDPFLDDAEDE